MAITGATPLIQLPGVGAAKAKALEKLGLHQAGQLIDYLPREYEDHTPQPAIAAAPLDTSVCFQAMVTQEFRTDRIAGGRELTKGKISDHSAQVQVVFFGQSYVKRALQPGREYLFYGKLTRAGRTYQLTNPQFTKIEDAETSTGLQAVYPLTAGISNRFMAGLVRQALVCLNEREEILPPQLLQEFQLAQMEYTYRSLHQPHSWEELEIARRRLIFEELFCLTIGLDLLRTRRQEDGAIPFQDRTLSPFYHNLPFSLTTAQTRSAQEAADDLGRSIPMNRLLQGDVGSGKTVVAAACAWLAWRNGCQCALMVPTELLAVQHLNTMETLLRGWNIRIGILTGSMTAAEKRTCRDALATGALDFVIGTHALLTKDVTFHQLGLVITDEQHRFGVEQRAALSAKAGDALRPHVLVMSATPIPRTLALMIYGDLDLSILDELPPGRKPVATYLIGEDKRGRLYGFIRKQVALGRQVYIVCPKVEQEDTQALKAAEQYGEELQRRVFPDLQVAILHGRRKAAEKEQIMQGFVDGTIDILVATTVIEVGVDVPNASLMVVENAERFGLSQLHQLRGRVGRGEHLSYCVLMTENQNEQTRARLKAFAQTNDGFQIAEEDLKLRGPGDFFGARQHGLPQLKMADLARDMSLLHQAQNAARTLLQGDPELKDPSHAPLQRAVYHLFAVQQDRLQ